MSTKAVTFEAQEDTLLAFDSATVALSLSREQAPQQLMERFLAYDKSFRSSVAIGLQQADAGLLIDHEEIEARVRQWEKEAEPSEQVI
jgi:predicted transcriptional regulator